ESMTQYFIENFENLKNKRLAEWKALNSDGEKEDKKDTYWEWDNRTQLIKWGYWANIEGTNFREAGTSFESIPILVRHFAKYFITNPSIFRFLWTKYDIREYLHAKKEQENYTPYMSISGTFFIDVLEYPQKIINKGTWDIRDIVDKRYYRTLEPTAMVKMDYIVSLSPKIYTKDLTNVLVGVYDQENQTWITSEKELIDTYKNTEKQEGTTLKQIKKKKEVAFETNPGIFSVLIERKINFPYKSWNLRCIKKENELVAILDLVTPRTKFVFELGTYKNDNGIVKAYVKWIDNQEEEFNDIADKEMTFDEIILALKDCGIILSPWKEDIEAAGLKEKNCETVDRAVDDIIMVCRYYSIRSHDFNKLISPNWITVKARPNPEFDKYFFEDEEKDWADFTWFINK
ncbi:MAG: hypothetical protein ACRC42_01930, partial [Mycoplasma sp.]